MPHPTQQGQGLPDIGSVESVSQSVPAKSAGSDDIVDLTNELENFGSKQLGAQPAPADVAARVSSHGSDR